VANRVRDLLLRITGDPSDAERALHDVAREVGEFGRLNAEATLDVNTKPVEAGLLKATAGVRKFGELTATAKIDLQIAGAEAQLTRLRTRLEALSRQDASPKVDIQVAKTVAQIERVEAKLTALGRRKVTVDVDVDRAGTAVRGLGALTTAAAAAGRGFGVLFTAVSGAIPVVGGVGRALTGAAASGAELGPVFLALIPVVLGLAVAIGVTLVTALGSLVASLAAAAAGVAVLGLALAAAFGPVLLVAIAAFSRLAAILKAVKESEEQAATEARRVRDAHAAQTAAADRLRQANANLKSTSVDAYRAMRDAAEEASDAVRGITDAELSRERAQLTLKQAKRDLADYRREAGLTSDSLDGLFKKFTNIDFRPKNLAADIRSQRPARRPGWIRSSSPTRSSASAKPNSRSPTPPTASRRRHPLNDANEKNAEFVDKGIAAYPPYAAAVKQASDAQTALAKSTTKLHDARQDQGKQLDKLNPLERRFATTFERLKTSLTHLVAPATDKIFKGVLDFFDDLDKFAGNTKVRDSLTRIGGAIGGVFRTLGRELRRKEVRDAFVEFANAAARMIGALGKRGAVDVFLILLRVARAALPYLEKFVSGIVDWLDKLTDKTGDSRRLRDIVKNLVDHFKTWWGLAKEVATVVGNFFKDSKEPGRASPSQSARPSSTSTTGWRRTPTGSRTSSRRPTSGPRASPTR
jgi:hypothetical protein